MRRSAGCSKIRLKPWLSQQWVIPSKADGEFVWCTQVILTQEAAVWEQARNSQGKAIDWRFTTADACINLKHLHPSIQSDRPPVCIDIFVNSVDLGLTAN
ncbi:MAG TPA: hypothetical protein VFA32_00810 [Dehalococcoidia bacterium]|nr:hypothetical protein [Dehalococcoidia bacterium]